jgi:hypothetical protein
LGLRLAASSQVEPLVDAATGCQPHHDPHGGRDKAQDDRFFAASPILSIACLLLPTCPVKTLRPRCLSHRPRAAAPLCLEAAPVSHHIGRAPSRISSLPPATCTCPPHCPTLAPPSIATSSSTPNKLPKAATMGDLANRKVFKVALYPPCTAEHAY